MNYKTHKNSYIFTVVLVLCMMLAACSDYLYDENGGKLNSEDRIQLSGDITQLSVTRVNDSGFCDGDVMGVYVVDYDGGTPGTLKPSVIVVTMFATRMKRPATIGILLTTFSGRTSIHISMCMVTIPSPIPRASTTISLRCRKTRARLRRTAKWAAMRRATSYGARWATWLQRPTSSVCRCLTVCPMPV